MTLDAAKLRKVAALLESPVDGEALSALRRATAMLRASGIPIADALCRGASAREHSPTAQEPAARAEEAPMPEKAMVCRFAVIASEELPGGLKVLRVEPWTRDAGDVVRYRHCLATGRAASVIEAGLFQDPNAEFLAKFNVPFRTHREDPRVASAQIVA